MKITYLVPNLGDAAAQRRFKMFERGGATTRVAGFVRQGQAAPAYEGVEPIELGVSLDAAMLQRAKLVAEATLKIGRIRRLVEQADMIVARNIEMLVLAVIARQRFNRAIPVVYECLDIHWLMLSRSAAGGAMRAIERRLLSQTSALIVSSPAFARNYFDAIQGGAPPHLLVENRLLDLDGAVAQTPPTRGGMGPPWRIGWFGIIRCKKSLEFLVDFARRRRDLVEIDIRGRPFLEAVPDIEKSISGVENVKFGGPYAAADLARLYADVHFSWAIDFYEEGQNSEWLLPNRLYESGSFGSVPIAMKSVETGKWLDDRGLGVTIDRLDDLEQTLASLTPERYGALQKRVLDAPRSLFVATAADCVELVDRLRAVPRHLTSDR